MLVCNIVHYCMFVCNVVNVLYCMCVLYHSGKEEQPWPIAGVKMNNQSINQSRPKGHHSGQG